MFSICSLYVHYMFTICSLYVHYMFTICSQYVHYMLTICSLYVHYMFTICSLYVHYMFTICSQYVHNLFTIYSLLQRERKPALQKDLLYLSSYLQTPDNLFIARTLKEDQPLRLPVNLLFYTGKLNDFHYM